MDVFSFWGVLRDAIIYNAARTEEGREWLKNARRIEQTEPDTAALHARYG